MTRAPPQRPVWRGAAVVGCSCWLAICPVAQVFGQDHDDDWSLTRPTAPRAGVPLPHGSSQNPDLRAASALQRALAAPFDSARLSQLLAAWRERDGDLQRLQGELDTRSQANHHAALLLARLQETLGDREHARDSFEKLVALDSSAAMLRAYAQFEHAAGQLDRERALLERALLAPQSQSQRAQLASDLGALCLELKDVNAARQHFAEAARASPGSLADAVAFPRALAARGDYVAAADAYGQALTQLNGDARVLPSFLIEWAKLQLSAARWDAALATFKRARRLLGSSSGLYVEALEGELEAHRRLGSLATFARELAAMRGTPAALLLARAYQELEQPNEALAALRRVLAAQPGDVATAERVIALLWREGRVEEVIAEYQRLVRALPHEPRLASELCQLLFQAGRRAEALTTLKSLARDNSRDVRLHEMLADLYARFGEAEAAHRELALLAKLAPLDTARFVTLGEAELARGHKDAARAVFKRVARGRATFASHIQMAQIYLDHEFANEALAEYDAAEKLRPADSQVLRGRAEVFARMFRYKDAIAEWQRGLAGSDPQLRRDARKQLVSLWDEVAELRRHVSELEQRCSYSPGSGFARTATGPTCDADSARMLADAYERLARHGGLRAEPLRQLRAAEDVWMWVVKLEPRNVGSLLSLERLRVKCGDLDGALNVLEQLTQVDAANQVSYLERMVGYARSRYRDAQAASYAQRAVDVAPNDASAHERLGDLFRAQHDLPRALASFARALALDPSRYELAFRIAQQEIADGATAGAEARLRSVTSASQDDELVLRAMHSLLALDASQSHLLSLERMLLPLALAEPPRPVYRRALLELYAVLVPELKDLAELAAIGRRAAKPLLEALVDVDPSQAEQAVLLLAEVGNASAARALLAVAESGVDLDLRRDALRVAATLAGDQITAQLSALVRARETRLANVAAWALARSQSASARAALREIVASPEPTLRSYGLLGLARRADVDAFGLLMQALTHDPHPFVRASAALGLGMLGSLADRSASAALAAISAQTQAPTLAQAGTLAIGLRGGGELASTLSARLFAHDVRVRDVASLALAVVDHEQRVQFDAPLQLDRIALTSLLQAARSALEALPRSDGTRHARELSAAAADALRGDDASKRSVLEYLARQPASMPMPPMAAGAIASDPRERTQVLGSELLPELLPLRLHPDLALRLALVEALSKLQAGEADELLMDLAEDREPAVRGRALQVLAARTFPDVPSWVERLSTLALSEPAFWLRQRAVRVLARLSARAATTTLLRVLLTDAYAVVRESAADALAGRDSSLVGKALAGALRDPEARVCAAAARALQQNGGDALRAARSDASLSAAMRELLSR